jgi:hypothetical protein
VSSERVLSSVLLAAVAASILTIPARGRAACDPRYQVRPPYYAFPAAAEPVCVAAGDWNEDGRTDVVAASVKGASLTLLLGSQGFHLLPGGEIGVAGAPRWVAAGDMNGDGHLDLVTTGDFGTTVLAGDGGGGFRVAAKYPYAASFVGLVDLDGNGSLDVALNGAAGGIAFLIMHGLDIGSVEELPGAASMSLGDFNEDGYPDLATTGVDAVVRLNMGDGTFGPPTVYRRDCPSEFIYVADANGDHHLDIIGGEEPRPSGSWCGFTLTGRGDGTFDPTYGPLAAAPEGLNEGPPAESGPGSVLNQWADAFADIDGDGERDRVSFGQQLSGLESGPWAVTVHPGGEARRVPRGEIFDAWSSDLVDVNADGIDDLVVTGDGRLEVFLRGADGWISGGGGTGGWGADNGYAVADVNGDGKADLVIGNLLFPGNGDGSFKNPPTKYFEAELDGLDARDVDEDGNVDVVAVRPNGTYSGGWPVGELALFRGNGDGAFRTPSALGITTIRPRLMDLDSDGHVDLVTGGGLDLMSSIFYGVGDGTFTAGPVLGGSWLSQHGDIDGDGRLDLVMLKDGATVIHRSTGRSYEAIVPHFAGYPTVADVDGDGKDDIITSGFESFRIHLSNGDGTFREPWPEAYGPGGVVMADRSSRRLQDIIVVTHVYDVHGDTHSSLTLVRNERNPNRPPVTGGARAAVQSPSATSHDMARVSIEGLSDPDGDGLTVRITAITQDEPVRSGQGPGSKGPASVPLCPDATIDGGQALIRWERDGAGNGREYALRFTAADGCGATSEGQVTVCVPHDPASPCVDDGQRFNSLACDGASGTAPVGEPLLTPVPRAGGADLRYAIADAAVVRLEVYDLLGRRLAVVANGWRPAGAYEARWRAGHAAGVYFARLTIGQRGYVKRFALLP